CQRLFGWAVGQPAGSPLARETSARLLQTCAIRQPLKMASIYAVTDFHVPGQPGKFGNGIALRDLGAWLPGLALVEQLTYQFHGVPWTSLTRAEQDQETQWLAARDKHGELVASAWRRDLHP